MRILVVSDLPRFVTGGAEMQAARLIEAWSDAGHEVVCLGRRMGARATRLGAHEITVRKIRTAQGLGRLVRGATYFASLAGWLWAYRGWADVVYTRFLGEAAVTAAILRRIGALDVPLVATPANAGDTGDAHFVGSMPFAARMTETLDRYCSAINLIAPDMERGLRRAGFGGANFTRIPNGIPVRAALARPPDRAVRTLLSVGRLARQKGYDNLLRAYAALDPASRRDARLRIAGDGPERASLLALAESLGIGAHVDWLGEIDAGAVREELESADVFVLPSRYEGMSNAALEAMEAGLPVLLTDCGGLDLHIDASMGWVARREDEASLALALAETLGAPWSAIRQMGMQARHCVVREFDMRLVAERYLALFADLASRGA